MTVPLTKYGWPQVAVFPAVILALMLILPPTGRTGFPPWAIAVIEIPLAGLLICVLAFFRDPYRAVPADNSLLLAPADGRITDIETIEEEGFIGTTALKIGIFLSILDAHINRSPCNAKVEKITYKKGSYKNARKPDSSRLNESNELLLVRTDSPKDRLLVRQISGAVARRIVCQATQGQQLTAGQKFGMIKFGSRTELYVTSRDNLKCLVKIGQKVKAGLTPLLKYEL